MPSLNARLAAKIVGEKGHTLVSICAIVSGYAAIAIRLRVRVRPICCPIANAASRAVRFTVCRGGL